MKAASTSPGKSFQNILTRRVWNLFAVIPIDSDATTNPMTMEFFIQKPAVILLLPFFFQSVAFGVLPRTKTNRTTAAIQMVQKMDVKTWPILLFSSDCDSEDGTMLSFDNGLSCCNIRPSLAAPNDVPVPQVAKATLVETDSNSQNSRSSISTP